MLQPDPTNVPVTDEPSAASAKHLRLVVDVAAAEPALGAGAKLAEARRRLGLSLDEVAERIRVRREFLEALEEMNIKSLPGKAYALAFLRSYVRALGLDEKTIVDQFQEESALTREDAQKQIRDPSSRPGRERPWLAAAILVLIAAGFVGWRMLERGGAAAPQVAESQALGPAPSAAAPPSVSPARVLEIQANVDAWLEARGPDGTVFLSRTLRAGDVYRPDPSPGWTLHARDGGAFQLYVDGVPAGPLGTAGMPVLGRAIDGIEPLTQAELASRS